MDKSLFKRNCAYYVLQVLSKYTSESGTHLSARRIGDLLSQDYGLQPDVRIITQAAKDLQALGYDVHCLRGSGNTGYYLGEHCIPLDKVRLITAGIESLTISPDDKIEIYETLERVTGFTQKQFVHSRC